MVRKCNKCKGNNAFCTRCRGTGFMSRITKAEKRLRRLKRRDGDPLPRS